MGKTVLLYIGHPAHYHNFRPLADELREEGHHPVVVVRPKDVMEALLQDCDHTIEWLPARKAQQGKAGMIWSVLKRERQMYRIFGKYRPDIALGTDIVIAHVGKVKRVPTIVVNEDDLREVPLMKTGLKHCTATLAPDACNVAPFEHKKISYPGFQELAYLAPNRFVPDGQVVKHLMSDGRPYFILRFAALHAHHDGGKTGIYDDLAQQLIDRLKPKGHVYITSERPLSSDLEPYRITIHPRDMHHALAFASLYIGDSQTMAAEAAVLGTPSLRFNDFVGKLGYLEELEHVHQLTFGIPTDQPDQLLMKIDELLETPNLGEMWKGRQREMWKRTIDVTAFWKWLIVNWPESYQSYQSGIDLNDRFPVRE